MMKKRLAPIFLSFVLIGTILYFVAEPIASEEYNMEVFQVPFGYFELPVPKEWNFLGVDYLGERQYMFCPNEISLDLLKQGVNLEALLTIKIITMDAKQSEAPIEELIKDDINYRVDIYEKGGTELKGEIVGPKKIWGISGFFASLVQPEEKEFLFLGKREHQIFEIHYSFDMEKESIFVHIFDEMLAGLNSLDCKYDGAKQTWEDKGKIFSILLPTDWHIKERDDGKTAQMFVSRERVEKETDFFRVGATCTKVRQFSKSFPQYSLESDKDIADLWASSILEASEEMPNKVFEMAYVEINGKFGLFWQRSFKPNGMDYCIQEYHVILTHNDDLYDIILEAPVMEFEIYEDMFLSAMGSLKLN